MKYGLLAGMLVPLFFLKKTGKFISALPSIRGVVETKHVIPGRIRLNVPKLVDNRDAAEILKNSVLKLESVNRVEADTITGSVVMEYQLNSVDPIMLIGAVVRVLGLDDEITGNRSSFAWKQMKQVVDSLDETLRNVSIGTLDIKSAVMLLLLSSIGFSLFKKRMFTLPDPTILSWWAYNQISK